MSSQSTSRSENEGIVASSLGERCTSIEQKVARIMGSQGEGVTGNRRALGFGRKTFRNLREVQEIMGKIANPPNFSFPTIKNPHEQESTSLCLFVRILQLQQIMQMILDTKNFKPTFSLSILFEDPGFHPFCPNFFLPQNPGFHPFPSFSSISSRSNTFHSHLAEALCFYGDPWKSPWIWRPEFRAKLAESLHPSIMA